MVYRVVLPQGAVIRQDVELASPVVGQVSSGSWVTVVKQAFSDFPADRAVVRLRLASGGWISAHLNHTPPNNLPVVECVGYDEAFDPNQPHLFHFHAQLQVLETEADTQSTDPTDDESMASASTEQGSPTRSVTVEGSQQFLSASVSPRLKSVNASGATYSSRRKMEDGHLANKPCLCCMESPRDATLVHGETGKEEYGHFKLVIVNLGADNLTQILYVGHIVVCLACARVLQAQGQKCPVCRQAIESVIRHFFG
jgi:hypothetical protein